MTNWLSCSDQLVAPLADKDGGGGGGGDDDGDEVVTRVVVEGGGSLTCLRPYNGRSCRRARSPRRPGGGRLVKNGALFWPEHNR